MGTAAITPLASKPTSAAFDRREVGDVADRLGAGLLGVEVAADQVGGLLRLHVRPGQRVPLAAGGAADVALAHDAADALAVHPPSPTPQFGVDARDAVDAAGGEVQHGDLVSEGVVGGQALLAGGFTPATHLATAHDTTTTSLDRSPARTPMERSPPSPTTSRTN